MKKLVLLALAAVSAAVFVLPAAASAGEWEMDPAGAAFTASNVGNTVLKTNNNETVTCTGSTGSGAYNAGSKTTGTIQLTFTGCKDSIFSGSCTSEGQAAGTIKTTAAIVFTNVYLTDNKTKPGLKLTGVGAEQHFATFTCAGGLFKAVVTGSVYGESESACGTASKEHKVLFKAKEHGVQEWMQTTATGEKFDLSSKITVFGATTTRTSSQDGTGLLKFTETATVTCV